MEITQIEINGLSAHVEFDDGDMRLDLSIDDCLKIAAAAKQIRIEPFSEAFVHNRQLLPDKGEAQIAWYESMKAEYAKVFGERQP